MSVEAAAGGREQEGSASWGRVLSKFPFGWTVGCFRVVCHDIIDTYFSDHQQFIEVFTCVFSSSFPVMFHPEVLSNVVLLSLILIFKARKSCRPHSSRWVARLKPVPCRHRSQLCAGKKAEMPHWPRYLPFSLTTAQTRLVVGRLYLLPCCEVVITDVGSDADDSGMLKTASCVDVFL